LSTVVRLDRDDVLGAAGTGQGDRRLYLRRRRGRSIGLLVGGVLTEAISWHWIFAAGMLLFARTPVEASYVVDLPPAMVLMGVGAGLGFPSLMTLAMSGATPSDSGLASGLVNTSVQVGGAIGLAVVATLATERTDGLLADGHSAASALNSGFHLAYVIGALLVAARS
jgi:hypothetical protein